MKYNDKKIARMILKKTTGYLRNAVVMFVCTMVALCFGILFMISYIQEQNENFENNDNVHMIKIEGRFLEKEYRLLKTGDYKKINQFISEYTKTFTNIPFYYIPQVHMESEGQQEVINLIALDKKKSNLLSTEEMEEMVAYTSKIPDKTICLSVPIYEEKQDGGMVIEDDVKYNFDNHNSIDSESPFSILRDNMGDLEDVYVTEGTLLQMLKDTKKIDKKVDSLLDDSIKDVVLIEGMYIYVDKLAEVDEVAEILKDSGYDITYTLEAFHSLNSSLQRILIFLSLLISILLISAVINIVLSFLSYIKIQQKDMGILKFHGFSIERIYKIYKSNISFVFAMMIAVISVFVIFGGVVILKVTNYPIFLVLCIAAGGFIFILERIVLRFGLKRTLNHNIMYLVKASKEFE